MLGSQRGSFQILLPSWPSAEEVMPTLSKAAASAFSGGGGSGIPPHPCTLSRVQAEGPVPAGICRRLCPGLGPIWAMERSVYRAEHRAPLMRCSPWPSLWPLRWSSAPWQQSCGQSRSPLPAAVGFQDPVVLVFLLPHCDACSPSWNLSPLPAPAKGGQPKALSTLPPGHSPPV